MSTTLAKQPDAQIVDTLINMVLRQLVPTNRRNAVHSIQYKPFAHCPIRLTLRDFQTKWQLLDREDNVLATKRSELRAVIQDAVAKVRAAPYSLLYAYSSSPTAYLLPPPLPLAHRPGLQAT